MPEIEITPPTPEQIAEARLNAINATHYGSWSWDEATCTYVPPIQPPNDGNPYVWDETFRQWVNFPEYPLFQH